jgi:hypothetical protein
MEKMELGRRLAMAGLLDLNVGSVSSLSVSGGFGVPTTDWESRHHDGKWVVSPKEIAFLIWLGAYGVRPMATRIHPTFVVGHSDKTVKDTHEINSYFFRLMLNKHKAPHLKTFNRFHAKAPTRSINKDQHSLRNKLKTLTIKSDLTLSLIEDYLTEITNSTEIKIRLPTEIKHGGGIGVEASLIQLIATWSRSQEEPIFHTYVDNDEREKGFSKICESFFGIAALALSRRIFCVDGKTQVNKSEALTPAKPRMDALKKLDFQEAFKGFRVNLPCIKSGAFSGLIEPLYNNDEVTNQAKFKEIISKSLEVAAPQKTTNRAINEDIKSRIGLAARQLFLNTDQHARNDEFGNEYLRDSRGILINVSSYTRSESSSISEQNRTLEKYLDATFRNIKDENRLRFLEISILDSGPGFSGRWLSKSSRTIEFEDESNAILCCFKKHSSTKSNHSSGNGLDIVLNVLHELNGWFRLRTGRAIVEKAFSSKTPSYEITAQDIKQSDAYACGSVFTFVIPLHKDS